MRILQALAFVLVAAAASAQTPPAPASHPGAARCGRAAGRRGQDRVRPRDQGPRARHRQGPPGQRRRRHHPLHRVEDRRHDVRQLGRARQAGELPRRPRDCRLQRRAAADGARREAPALDPGGARLQRRARAEGHAGLRHRAHRHPDARAGRREGAARRREEDGERPRLQVAASRAPADGIRRRAARSRCTTPAGRPTGRCSTARSCAASRPRSRSTA